MSSQAYCVCIPPYCAYVDVSALALLSLICRVLLRMAAHPSPHVSALPGVLRHALAVLERIEHAITWTVLTPPYLCPLPPVFCKPPHHARGLFDLLEAGSMDMWGDCVRALWRISMVQDDRGCWDALTCRLLIVRASSGVWSEGGRQEDVEEWARREAVRCLLTRE